MGGVCSGRDRPWVTFGGQAPSSAASGVLMAVELSLADGRLTEARGRKSVLSTGRKGNEREAGDAP